MVISVFKINSSTQILTDLNYPHPFVNFDASPVTVDVSEVLSIAVIQRSSYEQV